MKAKTNSLSFLVSSINKIGKFFSYLCAFFLLLMLLTVLYDVLMRYLFSKPTFWALEINEYFFIFISIMPAAEIFRKKRHIKLDLFLDQLSTRHQLFLETFYLFCTLFFCSNVVWRGTQMTLNAYKYSMASSSLLSFPLFVPYSIIPAGLGLLGLQIILRIVGNISMLKGAKK